MNPDFDARQRLVGVAVGLVLCAAYATMLAAATYSAPWVVVAAIVLAHGLEGVAERNAFVRPLLRRAQLAPGARALLRDGAVLLLVADTRWAGGRPVHLAERLLVLVVLLRFVN